MKKLTAFLFLFISMYSEGQVSEPFGQPYYRQIPNEGQPVNDRFLREANVKYSKRIHRVIDLRQKQNKVATWPKNSINDILYKSCTNGLRDFDRVPAYKSDSLTSTYTVKEILERGGVEIPVPVEDPPGSMNFVNKMVNQPFEVKSIIKIRIMEDWLFDNNYSDFRPRIIAIAPLFEQLSATGYQLGEAELFWLKMSDLRPILAQQEVFNSKNQAAQMSFDHWFRMRLFASHIVKEANVYDSDIKYLPEFMDNGIAALMESDKIKNDLFVVEHDLWEY